MKYIITESKIKSIMWNYLNSPEYDVFEDEYEILLTNKNDEYDWRYTFEDGRLLVANHIISGLEGLFNISGEDSLEYAGEWFFVIKNHHDQFFLR